jgi:hypothetical protein
MALAGYTLEPVDRVPRNVQGFPPRHEPASFSIDQAVAKLEKFLASDQMHDHWRS